VKGPWVVPQPETHVASIWPALAINTAHDVDEDAQEAVVTDRSQYEDQESKEITSTAGRVRTYILSQP
jgi:hypothetical protein